MRSRASCLLALGLAACSEAPPAKVEDAPPASLAAGQWELTREVTEFEKMDEGASAMTAKAGDKATSSVCLAPGDTAAPPSELLTGRADMPCTQSMLYVSNGRINASLSCKPAGLAGTMSVSSDGTFTADALDLTLSGSTLLPGSGDVRIEEKLTGRRTGACTSAKP